MRANSLSFVATSMRVAFSVYATGLRKEVLICAITAFWPRFAPLVNAVAAA